MKHARRILPALVIALILGGSAISQAQIICSIPCPTWDISAILKNIAINALKKEINDKLGEQGELLKTMANRLSTVASLANYAIAMDDTPEWRIHDWFTGFNLYSNDFQSALTYGDPSGAGYDSVSLPRARAGETALGRLSPDAANYLRQELATLEIADSVIIRGTNETGRQRFNGREEARTIDELQRAVTDDDDEQSVTAVMDKISAAGLMEAQDKQARIQLQAAALEQLTVDNMRDRNSDTMQMNMTLNQLRDGRRIGQALVQGSENTLRTWRQP
jgi:hypothetical protein